jgi:hypothetical protein
LAIGSPLLLTLLIRSDRLTTFDTEVVPAVAVKSQPPIRNAGQARILTGTVEPRAEGRQKP